MTTDFLTGYMKSILVLSKIIFSLSYQDV